MSMKSILCIGGTGTLGKAVIQRLLPHNLLNIDLQIHDKVETIKLDPKSKATMHQTVVLDLIKKKNPKFDSIIVTAGGWAGGSIKDDDYVEKIKNMNDICLFPSLMGAHLASKFLNPGGIVVLTGAAAVFKEPQPDMLAYALAKTGVHSLALNLAQFFIKQNSQSKVITILPQVIDTENNRKAMPNADFSTWAKPKQIADLVKCWVDGLNVPNNGSFAVLKVKNNAVVPQFV